MIRWAWPRPYCPSVMRRRIPSLCPNKVASQNVRQKIYESANPLRGPSIWQIDCVDGHAGVAARVGLPIGENSAQATCLDISADKPTGRQDKTGAADRGLPQYLRIVRAQVAAHADRLFRSARKSPIPIGERQAIVAAQVRRRLRLTMLLEIIRARADQPTMWRQLPRKETGGFRGYQSGRLGRAAPQQD